MIIAMTLEKCHSIRKEHGHNKDFIERIRPLCKALRARKMDTENANSLHQGGKIKLQ